MAVTESVRTLSAGSVALGLLLAGACTGSSDQGLPEHQAVSPDCTRTITQSDDVRPALQAASPGSTLCFAGGNLADAEVTMTRSGTSDSQIRLIANGATVDSVHIRADHVDMEGFTVTGGEGVFLEGTGITARHNTVHDTQRDGIVCMPCTDSTIASNNVQHASATGIYISGQRICDISDQGYRAPPHPDCFQTFDHNPPPSTL